MLLAADVSSDLDSHLIDAVAAEVAAESADPHYSGDPGNLVDEVATVIVKPEITLGIDMKVPFTGTAIKQNVVLKMGRVQQQISCSEGTPLPVASPGSPIPPAP